jgi:hypothetical protein
LDIGYLIIGYFFYFPLWNSSSPASHQKPMLMSQLRPWQLIMLAVFTAVVCFALVQGIKYESFWGITGALGSSVALLACIKIMLKMNQLEQEEEY